MRRIELVSSKSREEVKMLFNDTQKEMNSKSVYKRR